MIEVIGIMMVLFAIIILISSIQRVYNNKKKPHQLLGFMKELSKEKKEITIDDLKIRFKTDEGITIQILKIKEGKWALVDEVFEVVKDDNKVINFNTIDKKLKNKIWNNFRIEYNTMKNI